MSAIRSMAVAAGATRIVYLSNFAATEGDEDWFAHIHGMHQRLMCAPPWR